VSDIEKAERQRMQKKRRYRDDAEFAERVRGAARSRYVPKESPSERKRGRNKSRAQPIGDQLVVCLGLGEAADRLGIHKTTLNRYEDRGVIPLNRLIDSRQRRWYPEAFVEFLAPIFKRQSDLREPLWRLRLEVERAWKEALEAGEIPVVEPQPQEQSSE